MIHPETIQFRNAVEYLKAERIIKKDSEIAAATKYDKGAVSSYLSGRVKPSKPFIAAFEDAYKVRLGEFAERREIETFQTRMLKYQEGQLKLLALIAKANGVREDDIMEILASVQPKARGKKAIAMQQIAEDRLGEMVLFKGRIKR